MHSNSTEKPFLACPCCSVAHSSSAALVGWTGMHSPTGYTDLMTCYLSYVVGRFPVMQQGLFPFQSYDGLASGHTPAGAAGSILWVLPGGLLLSLCSLWLQIYPSRAKPYIRKSLNEVLYFQFVLSFPCFSFLERDVSVNQALVSFWLLH